MGTELLEIGVKLRKGVIFAIRWCFGAVCNHPFLVGFLCFLILLHRSSPFIFSLLVSFSPILVCTAVLLGVLLSYGEPNIPEIEIEEKTTFEAVSVKTTGVLGDAAVVEQNGSYFIARSDDTAPLIKERSQEFGSGNGEISKANRELSDSSDKLKNEWIDEKLNDPEVVESDGEKSDADSFDSETVNVDSLDSPPRSPWKRIEEREDEEEDERADDSESESDRAESSSPDASMADIMPMLDELHPLLDEDNPQPVRMSHSGSDSASESSSKSSGKSHESDDETENLEVQDDDNEEDGEDEDDDAQGDKEEETKSAITWTEEDQKNLMDLGSSELERNQRLENLILRRRARRNLSVVPERNLIDLESTDYPLTLPPISTRRQNPFDLPHDSYDNNLGLPPIPGSAPSILSQRRNPFDIPYDSSEEKPDLMGDGFKEEFTTLQSREMVFRRHESFNVGPSRMRPYFVPEGTISEESSYSTFQRQSSELSESKVSSVPETESIGSAEDLEDKKLSDEDNRQELETSPRPKELFEGPSGDQHLISHQEDEEGEDKEDKEEEDVHREPELISEIENVPELVGHGSQSSEDDEESLEVDHEVQLEDVGEHYQQESETGPVEAQATEYHPNYEGGEQVCRSDSSSSSLSEVSERVFNEIEGELEERRDGITEERSILTETSTERTLAIDVPQRVPVYDSSPRGIVNNVSSSSSSVGRESEGSCQEIETDVCSNVEILHETSITHHPVDEPRAMDVVDVIEHDTVNTDFSEVEKESEREGFSADSGIISDVSVTSESSVEALVEECGLGEVLDSRADENILNLDKSSEGPVEVSEPLFEGQQRAECTIGREVTAHYSNADAYHRTEEKLISTPSAEENTCPVDANEVQEPNFQHLDDVQASSAVIDLNRPEVQELDHDVPSNINSPLSPEFISNPHTAAETTDSHVNVETTIEEVYDIKEIDEEMLSELDNIGDFSVNQWGSSSNEFKKHIDSVDSAEGNNINVVHSEKSREDIDMHDEEVEYNSELQKTSKTSGTEHINVSRVEFKEIDGHGKISENETVSKENEAQPVHSVISHNYEDNISEKPEMELQSTEDVDFVSKKDESITYRVQVDTETTSEMAELEASKLGDIDMAKKQIIANEGSEKPMGPEPPRAELVINETLDQHSKNGASHENSSTTGPTEETSVLEVRAISDYSVDRASELEMHSNEFDFVSKKDVSVYTETTSEMAELEASNIRDIDLAFKQITANETEKPIVQEPPQAELVVNETLAEHSKNETSHENSSAMGPADETSDLEVGAIEKDAISDYSVDRTPELDMHSKDFDFVSKKDESTFTETSSEMAELEASKTEDIDLEFKQITEPPQVEPVVNKTLAEHSKIGASYEHSSATGPTDETSVIEVRAIEKDATSDYSVDCTVHVVDSSELHVAENVLSDGTFLPSNDKVLDGKSIEQVKLNLDGESVEVKADKVGLSVVESNVQEIGVASEKPNHEVEEPKDSHSTSSVEGKGKISRSSSSSSSSSSKSSSSDSDKE